MTDRAYMSIGEVLALLQAEFPDVTISKIRFLESQGLIDPERTPSGYRKFYPADIERLRWILKEQRENFLPLKVIKDRLESGEPITDSEPTVAVAETPSVDLEEPVPTWLPKPPRPGPPAPPPARPAATPGVAAPRPAGAGYTFDEIVVESGLNPAQLKEVEGYGLLANRWDARRTTTTTRSRSRGSLRSSCSSVSRRGICACTARLPSVKRASSRAWSCRS